MPNLQKEKISLTEPSKSPSQDNAAPADVVSGAKPLSQTEQAKLADLENSYNSASYFKPNNNDDAEKGKIKSLENQLINSKLKIIGFLKNPRKSGPLAGMGLIIGTLAFFAIPYLGVAELMTMSKDLEYMTADTTRHNNNMLKRLYYYSKSGDVGKTRLGILGNANQVKYDRALAKSGITLKSSASGGSFSYEIDFTKGDGALKDGEAKAMAKEAHLALQREGIASSYTEGSTKVDVNGKSSIFSNKEGLKIHKYMLANFTNRSKILTALTLRNAAIRTGMPSWNIVARADAKYRSATFGKVWDLIKNRTQNEPKKLATIPTRPNPDNSQDIATENKTKTDASKGIDEVKRLKAIPKAGTGIALAGIGAVCVVKQTLSTADTANKLQNRSVSIKMAQTVLIMSAQIVAGQNVDLDGIGEVVELFRQSEEYKKQLESEGKPPQDNSRLQNYMNSGGVNTAGYELEASKSPNPEQSELARALDNPTLNGACGFMENPLIAIASVAVAPFSSLVTMGAMAVIEPLVVSYLTNEVIDVTAPENRGSVNKELAFAGAHLIANENAFAVGGNEQSNEQASVYYEEFKQDYVYNQTAYDKYFDITNSKAIAGTLMSNVYTIDRMSLVELPSSIFKNISSILTPNSVKAGPSYNAAVFYGLPNVRLAPEVTKYENPYETAQAAQVILTGPQADKYKDLVTKCHRLKVVNEANELDFKNAEDEPGLTDESTLPEECNNNSDENLNIIRNAIFATITMKADTCYSDNTEVGKEACKDIGIEEGAQAPSSGGGVVSGDKAELISKILANPRIKTEYYENDSNDSINKVEEELAVLEIGLLRGLATIGEKSGVDIIVTDLLRENCNDFHCQGQALDIGYWGNGQPRWVKEGDQLFKYLHDNKEDLKVNELIWWKPPEGYSNLDEGKPHDYGEPTNSQHIHHIHVSFDN